MTWHRITLITGNMKMLQVLLAAFMATASLGTPLPAVDVPPELPLWEKPPPDYAIRRFNVHSDFGEKL